MLRILKYAVGTLVVVVCITIVYQSWLDFRYARKIPQYLKQCRQQSVQSSSENRDEELLRQNFPQIPVVSHKATPWNSVKTKLGMTALALEIASHAWNNGALPKSTGELGLDQKQRVDAWSSEYTYIPESDTVFILCSPGNNKVFEGEVINGEIAGRYSLNVFQQQLEGNAVLRRFVEHRGYLGEVR